VSERLRLDGTMIPRSVKRMFDQRDEPRADGDATVLLIWRGATLAVPLVNLSPSGAMVSCGEIPHIGEAVALQLPDRPPTAGVVRWVRDGRIGVNFAMLSR
jgi:hypothetical protein